MGYSCTEIVKGVRTIFFSCSVQSPWIFLHSFFLTVIIGIIIVPCTLWCTYEHSVRLSYGDITARKQCPDAVSSQVELRSPLQYLVHSQ